MRYNGHRINKLIDDEGQDEIIKKKQKDYADEITKVGFPLELVGFWNEELNSLGLYQYKGSILTVTFKDGGWVDIIELYDKFDKMMESYCNNNYITIKTKQN